MLLQPAGPSMPDMRSSYVVLSDVHLGADLVEHVRPWSRHTWLRQQVAVDERLETLLRHHARTAEGRVCFVLAGDFVDFMGMSLAAPPASELPSGLTDEEHAHGLGSAADHAVLKLEAVAQRHEAVFRALAEVLSQGHRLAVVRGNHDLEWHWGAVQRAFVEALCVHAAGEEQRAAIRAAVSFRPWFFHVPGLLYVEHGHEYDPMCGQGDPLSPVCLRDTRRIRLTTSHVLMRYVARPTPGLSTVGHEHVTFAGYCALATSFGLIKGLRLGVRFARATLRLLREVLIYRWHRSRLDRSTTSRLRALARRDRIAHETLAALRRLHVRPGTQSVRAVLSHLYWDRVALVLFAGLGVLFTVASLASQETLLVALAHVASACIIAAVSSARDIDPSHRMRSSAPQIAEQLGVRYVVMGHTHEPRFDALAGGAAHYVNLGFWGEDELPEDRRPGSAQPPCTYFFLRPGPAGYEGGLLRWDPQQGPTTWVPPAPEQKASATPAIPASAPLSEYT
jgi:UDP-2,3-diacylglucosamine pyrophosphatase LpxH